MACICGRGAAAGPWCLGCRRDGSRDFLLGGIPISASSGALTWDDMSTGLGKSPSLGDGGVSMTTGFSLFRVEFPDACPDMSNTAWDRSSLIPWSCWPLFTPLVGEPWWDLALGWGRSDCWRAALWDLALPWWAVGPLLGKWVCLQAGLCLWPAIQAGRLLWGPHTHSALLGRWPKSLSWGVGRTLDSWFISRWHSWCLPLWHSDAPP